MKASDFVQAFDRWNASLSQKWGSYMKRYALAIIYIWFGILKPFGMSPAGDLVAHTVFWCSPDWFLPILGIFETAIGLMLLYKPSVRIAILMIYLHLPGTFLPFLTFPESTHSHLAFELTLEGQYIIKNLIIFVTALSIGGALAREGGEKIEKHPFPENNPPVSA